MKFESKSVLTPLEAAHHLGITSELLFQYTKPNFGKSRDLRPLETVEQDGQTRFSLSELDTFNSMLGEQWCDSTANRPPIPPAILNHLRAESQNQCSRCGSGIGVETAHIRPWAISKSHHPHNLIRLCSACHREHDVQHSLTTEELKEIKERLIARTRANLMDRMQQSCKHLRSPRASPDFVGRENELKELVNALRLGRSAVVYGVGGIGKSELLLQAISRCDTGRPVLWCNIEQYSTVADVVSALRTAIAVNGQACSHTDLPSRLDATHTCVVFDGIEQASLDDLDEFEDTVYDLFHATIDTQFVSTSQVLLHRLPADIKLNLGGLSDSASQSLLSRFCPSVRNATSGSTNELLGFCDGHALTIKISGALTEHYGSAAAAMNAIHRRGAKFVNLPGRKRNNRQTSLELCLQTAYQAQAESSRKLLWALAQAPAGIWTTFFEHEWLDLDDTAEALASLRKWHLVEMVFVENRDTRTRLLTPVRRFVIECGREENTKSFEHITGQVVLHLAIMVAVLELKYDTPEETSYAVQRFGDELPNLLHVLELAQEQHEDDELVTSALAIVQSLMRYYFVLNLPEQGAQVMLVATDLAFHTQRIRTASGLMMQSLGLVLRTKDETLLTKCMEIVNKIEKSSEHPEVLADVAMCQAMAAQAVHDFQEAEQFSRKALKGYQKSLMSLKDGADEDGSLKTKRNDLHNNCSNALGILGYSLLSQQKYVESSKAYRHSIKNERGGSIGVNRGQSLHQIGNCESNLGNHAAAARLYIEAAKVFHLVGMQEYLSNACGELGYTLLDFDFSEARDHLDDNLIDHLLVDLSNNAAHVFDSARPLNHQQCIEMIRKLFGTVILLSLTGYGAKLGVFCIKFSNETIADIARQIKSGSRSSDELFPIMVADFSMRLGILIAECENELGTKGDVEQDTLGNVLRTVCEANDWVQINMRVLDWTAVYFTRRLKFSGIDAARIEEFARNYREDVEDYLDLAR